MRTTDETKNDAYSGGEEEEEEPKQEVQPFKYYLQNEQFFKIVTTKWGVFCGFSSIIYLYHLCFTIAGVNAYADYTRMNECGDPPAAYGDDASALLDTAIALSTVWHMIEWIRWTLLMTAALVDANLIFLFKLFAVNVPFGFIVSIIAIATRYSANGNSCAEEGKQSERAFFLGLQVICLIVYIPTCFAHIVFMKIKGVEWCHEMWLKEDDDDEEEKKEEKTE